MPTTLPAEIWTQIFDLATDEDILFQPGIPTSMAESAWFKDLITGQWRIRSPQEAMNSLQRRSYATKKAIKTTCRQWRELGSEYLFRCLHFSDPFKMITLAAILDSAPTPRTSLCWWTRRIHVSRFHSSTTRNASIKDMENALVSIIQHCPNLEIFVMERPMGEAFGPVADALSNYSYRKLHTVQWNAPGDALAKVIWALSSLPRIVAAHIDIETPVEPAQECANLGSATNLNLRLPNLQQLSLRGYVEEFVEQCAGWDLPSLHGFCIDSGSSAHDVPDVVDFLRNHGSNLDLLDLNLDPVVDIATLLDLCPNLSTFTFNGDWRILPHDEHVSEIAHRPHQHITTIGVHGLSRAFGVGHSAALTSINSMGTRRMRHSNDLNMAALNKRNFPKLCRVRALSRMMLNDLNQENGPSREDGGYERWNTWWHRCTAQGIRLEDCTGLTLGTLPMDDESDEEDSSEEEEEESGEEGEEDEDEDEEYDTDEWGSHGEPEEDVGEFSATPLPVANGRTMELTRLLQEVRIMNASRDEALIARIRPELPPSP